MRSNCPGITIYNAYVDAATRSNVYQRSQILGVTWENRRAANKSSAGEISANSASIYIPLVRGANYVEPVAWRNLVAKTGKWTLQNGDIVVRGLVSDEITGAFTESSLKAKYNDCLVIASVDFMDLGSANIKHWQVEAR